MHTHITHNTLRALPPFLLHLRPLLTISRNPSFILPARHEDTLLLLNLYFGCTYRIAQQNPVFEDIHGVSYFECEVEMYEL